MPATPAAALFIATCLLLAAAPIRAQTHLGYVTVGSNPQAIAVDTTTNKIYVANFNGNEMTVINGADNTAFNVPLAGLPNAQSVAIGLNKVTSRAYVVNRNVDTVTIFDLASPVPAPDYFTRATAVVGDFPVAVAVNEVTDKAYIANFTGTVTVISGNSTTVSAPIAAGLSPVAIALNPVTNKAYVVNQGGNSVTVLNGAIGSTPASVAVTVPVGTSPRSAAVNTVTNKIYVANAQGTNEVTKIDGATNVATHIQTSAGTPTYVAVNEATNRIYVANSGGSVTVIDGSTDTVLAEITNGNSSANFSNPQMAAVNPVTNRVYVVNAGNTSMTVINGVSNAATNIFLGLFEPRALAVNPLTNRIYATDSNANEEEVAVLFGETAARNFDGGGGPSDVIWKYATTGTTLVWRMNGTAIAGTGSPASVGNAGWNLQGAGDFNGDGRADILWRNSSSGAVLVWLMNTNGTSIMSTGSPATVAPDSGWEVQGVGDFNGDGRADVLWKNTSNGTVLIWLMNANGTSIMSSASAASVPAGWEVQGVGDFNGDGKSDILWRNTASGVVLIWLMNGTAIAGSGSPATVSDANWVVQGVGDFNGDGRADVLWKNASSGTVLIWLTSANGTSIQGTGSPATVGGPGGWEVKGVGDYNADGRADVFWRHAGNGNTLVWLMNASGTGIASSGTPATVSDPNWQVQNPK